MIEARVKLTSTKTFVQKAFLMVWRLKWAKICFSLKDFIWKPSYLLRFPWWMMVRDIDFVILGRELQPRCNHLEIVTDFQHLSISTLPPWMIAKYQTLLQPTSKILHGFGVLTVIFFLILLHNSIEPNFSLLNYIFTQSILGTFFCWV